MAFAEHIARILQFEGGYVDNPKDPGGATKFGISLKQYPHLGREGIKALTPAEASAIYHRDYWIPIRGDEIDTVNPKLALVMLDTAINSGPHAAIKYLQFAILQTAKGTKLDENLGPLTMQAIGSAKKDSLIAYFLSERAFFLIGLSTWPTFGKGWMRRLFALLAD